MTSNPPAVTDHETLTVRRTIAVAASPEKVWAAVTEPDHISRWFGKVVLVVGPDATQGSITWPGQAPIPIRVEAIDPPRSVTYRWWNDDTEPAPDDLDDAPSTIFTFTLVPTADGTELTVVETGFGASAEPGKQLEEHRDGWDGELDKLVALLEGDPR